MSGSVVSSQSYDNHHITVLRIDGSSPVYRIEDFFLNSVGAKKLKDIRRMYSQNILESNDKTGSFFAREIGSRISRFRGQLWENAWLLRIISMFLDLFLCVAYLYEIEFNINNVAPKDIFDVPSWLFINRPQELWYLLLFVVYLKFVMIILFSQVWYRTIHLNYLNTVTVTNAVLIIIFCSFAFVPRFQYLYYPYWLFCINIVYNIRMLSRIDRRSMPFKITEFSEKLWVLLSTAVALVYASMCIINYIETHFRHISKTTDLDLLNSFYLIIITFTTVGFGDVTPQSKPGQIALVFLIMVALIVLPLLIDDVIETLRKQARGAGSFSNYSNRPFVILVGEFSDTHRILHIIHTIQRRDYLQKTSTVVVLLARTAIPQDLSYAIKEYKLRQSVEYYLQSGTNQYDLERVKPESAKFIFILSNYRIEDRAKEDNHNLLQAMAFDSAAPNIPIYVETRLPNTAENLQDVVTGVICLASVKQTFLAYGTLYQGISTLLVNLLRGCLYKYYVEDPPWLDQYLDGAKNEIFKVPFGPAFIGKSFSQVSLHFYRRKQIILFACHIYVKERNVHHVALNPRNYLIKESDHGFVIAQSADGLKDMMNEPISEFEKGLQSAKQVLNPNHAAPLVTKEVNRAEYLEKNNLFLGYPAVHDNGKIPLCVLAKDIPKLEDCILQNADGLENHIVIVSDNFYLFRLVCALRTAHFKPEEILPILIMTPKAPTSHEFSRFAGFPQVFFIVGYPHKASHLRLAGVAKAFRIIVTNLSKHHSREMTDDSILDSNVIMVANAIHRIFRDQDRSAPILVDLMHSSNAQFLLPGPNNFKPRKLRTGKENVKKARNDTFISPMFASGGVLSVSMIESVMINTYFQKSILNLFNCFAGIRYKVDLEIDEILNLEVSNVSYIKVPAAYVDKTFGQLFEALSAEGVIPIGILRGVVPELQNTLPFVYTNPVWDLILLVNDFIYILA